MQQIALLLLAAAIAPGLAAGTSSVIATTCAAVSNGITGMYNNYDTCVGVLSADPGAASATDARGLAAAAANLTAANVTSTVLVLADLVHNLSECLSYYRGMNESVAGALNDVRAGRASAAEEKLLQAYSVPDDCDILLFEGSAKKNPLSQENLDAKMLAYLAYGLRHHRDAGQVPGLIARTNQKHVCVVRNNFDLQLCIVKV